MKKSGFQWNIRSKLLLFITALLVLTAFGSSFTAVFMYNRAYNQQIEEHAQELSSVVLGSHLAALEAFETAEELLEQQMLDSLYLIAELLAVDGINQSVLTQLAAKSGIEDIYITDGDGVTIFCSDPTGVGWRFPDDPEAQAYPFRALLDSRDGVVAQKAAIRDRDGQLYKYVGISRPDQSGIIQVGVTALSLQEIQDSIGTQSMLEKMVESEGLLYGYVVDDSGIIQYHSDPAMLGQVYSGEGLEGYGRAQDIYEYEVDVPGSPGEKLIIGLSTADFNSIVRSARNKILLWSVLIVVLAGVVMWFWSGTFSASVRSLVDRIEVLATGDFSHPITAVSSDELGQAHQALEKLRQDMGRTLTETLSTAAGVGSSAEQLAASTEETSASIEEVASTSNEFAGTVEIINENARVMSASVSEISSMAADGERALESAVQRANELHDAIAELASSVEGLGLRSAEIGMIVDTISDIAEQTNLLALNAAIEAARAGEHGRGFAVVAEEVRMLAEQSGTAADNIAELIRAIQTEADRAVEGISSSSVQAGETAEVVQETGSVLRQILEGIERISKEVHQVFEGTQNIQFGSEQLAAATEEQSAAMEEVAALAADLGDLSQRLSLIVEKFKVQEEQ